MKLVLTTILLGLTLLGYSGESLTLNSKPWKVFKWVKDGTATEAKQDATTVLTLSSENGSKGIHYYLDKEIPITSGLKIQVSYEFRSMLISGKKAYISSGFYLHDSAGKYINSAVSAGGTLIKSPTITIWKSKSRTVEIPTKRKGKNIKFVKFFFAMTKGAVADIKNLKVTVVANTQKKSHKIAKTAKFTPLIKQGNTFPLGQNWTQRKIGSKDFYLAEQGNYIRMKPAKAWRYYETGIFPTMIPGHWRLQEFTPGAKLLPWQKTEVNDFLTKQWPLFSINYQRMFGNEAPSKATLARVNDIWIGDGQPEEPIYRLEPVFHFLKTGKKWVGSSMYLWKDKYALNYLKNELKPLLNKELLGSDKANYQWNRKKLKKLKDLYCLSYLAVNARPICWTMYLAPYAIAATRPEVVTVASKGADAYLLALARGVIRQSGGNKFLLSWRGHEPTEQFTYQQRDFYNKPSRENWGYPLPHLKYYIFRPYLAGVNYYMNEGFPGSLIYDLEDNNTFRLTPVGRITKDLIKYTKRVPQRGTIYTPVALVQGWYRGVNERDYGGKISFDTADWMNYALIRDLLFQEHRDTRNSGSYSVTAPYGEIIDLLKPNPEKAVDPKIFDGYKVLILTGGITLSEQYKKTLENYVKNGGMIVINAVDAKQNFNSDFTGVAIGKTFTASTIKNIKTGKQFKENKFKCLKLTLKGAKILYATGKKPAVTINKYGKGGVIVTAPKYLVTAEKSVTVEGRSRKQTLRPLLLNFCDDFVGNLFASVTPFMVKVAPEHRPDISWVISKQGSDWTVAMFNYSLKREELVARTLGTAKIAATYPYKSVPFEIVANVPANDVVELFGERNVKYQKVKGKLTVQESMKGGDILIYKFSPEKIKLSPYKRTVNLALNKPVTVSSTYKQFSAGYTVDGSDNNDYFWQSGVTKRKFTMPQWLTVDLGQTATIDHIKLVFHVWQQLSLNIRKDIYRYKIQTSQDGQGWTTVIDESKNETPAEPGGTETWFKPVKARYVKLLVLRNASYSGTKVVEFAVMGKNTELYQPKRQSIVTKWQVNFPADIEQATGKQVKYLRSIKPLQVKPGWMPTGKTWSQLNGWVRLYTDINNLKGSAYPQSLYGESIFEAEYAIPANAKKFIAVCGFGNRDRRASVEFKVYVDGQLKYDSGIYRIGMRLLPVVVDVTGGSKLKLVTTDAGDGIVADYAWWGDARFILP